MKGILYGNFFLNRTWFIAAAVLAALGVAVTGVLHSIDPMSGAGDLGLAASEFVVSAVCLEWLARNLESNLKSRFVDYSLTGGITKVQFVMAELLKNLITVGLSFGLCVLMQAVLCVFDSSFLSMNSIKALLVLELFMGAIEWTVNPLVINLKSAEKAGLVVGLVLGFGIVMPLMIICNVFSEETSSLVSGFFKLLSGNWMPLIVAGCSAALYALFYFALLARVKKGDVC